MLLLLQSKKERISLAVIVELWKRSFDSVNQVNLHFFLALTATVTFYILEYGIQSCIFCLYGLSCQVGGGGVLGSTMAKKGEKRGKKKVREKRRKRRGEEEKRRKKGEREREGKSKTKKETELLLAQDNKTKYLGN